MKKFLIIIFFATSLTAKEPSPIYPEPLKKGDLVAIVFPASYVPEYNLKIASEIVQKKEMWLKKLGYKTVVYPSKVIRKGYLSGSDQDRAKALMDAFKNKDVKAIWCYRGGYGSPRILDLLDYDYIKENPKILIGMSDITALHIAIQKKTGVVTYLGPVLHYFGEGDGEFQEKYAVSELEPILSGIKTGNVIYPEGLEIEVLRPGKARGKLVGGNLAMIASLCGTKWQLDTKGKILVLEDINEEPYKIDRMLWQLRESGLLEEPAAVILGSFTKCYSTSKVSLTLQDVFKEYFGASDYPVIFGFPTGHGAYQTTLPLNSEAELNTAHAKLKLL